MKAAAFFSPDVKNKIGKSRICFQNVKLSVYPRESRLLFDVRLNMMRIRTHLKNRILVQDRGGAEFLTGGILLYVEDLKRDTNKNIGPKDIFEMGSSRRVDPGTSISA
jgi:hypothetical protein